MEKCLRDRIWYQCRIWQGNRCQRHAGLPPIQIATGRASTSYVGGGICILETGVYCFYPEARAVDPEVMDEQLERFLGEEGLQTRLMVEN